MARMSAVVFSVVRDLPLGQVGVLHAQDRLQIREGEPVRRELRGIRVDAHGRQRTAADDDLPDSLNLRQLLQHHRRGFVVELVGAEVVRREAEDDDRSVGGVDLSVARVRRQIRGQIGSRRVDGGLDVARRAVDVATQIELDRDRRVAQAARGRHLRDGGDVTELPLERRGDRRGHDGCARTGKRGVDRNRGKLDLRQRRDGQDDEGQRPRERHGDREQCRRNRPPNERRRDVHAGSAACSPASGLLVLLVLRPKRRATLSKKM